MRNIKIKKKKINKIVAIQKLIKSYDLIIDGKIIPLTYQNLGKICGYSPATVHLNLTGRHRTPELIRKLISFGFPHYITKLYEDNNKTVK